jgi:hypothetical protein
MATKTSRTRKSALEEVSRRIELAHDDLRLNFFHRFGLTWFDQP